MTEWRKDELIALARRCGRIALGFYGGESELKSDGTVVTAADRAVEAELAKTFDRPEEGSFLIGEETVAEKSEAYLRQALASDACWVVDPIDGTAAYSSMFPSWGVSIGLVRQGVFAEGLIFHPALGELLVSDGGNVFLARNVTADDDRPLKFERLSLPDRALSVGDNIACNQFFVKRAILKFPQMVFATASCVTPFHWLACGRFAGQFITAKAWDVAAGLAILDALGFALVGVDSLKTVKPVLNEEHFILEAGASRRWGQRERLVAAARVETARYLAENTEVPS